MMKINDFLENTNIMSCWHWNIEFMQTISLLSCIGIKVNIVAKINKMFLNNNLSIFWNWIQVVTEMHALTSYNGRCKAVGNTIAEMNLRTQE